MSIISLLSDFGNKDPYVAEMKAVIVSINSNVQIIDLTHEVEKFNIHMGAYILASAAPFFPSGTVHVAVVDPGVGTQRRPIIVETEHSLYVGPDNGVLMLSAHQEKIVNVYRIDNPKYMLSKISTTFHGRDVFAPVAAYLTKGETPSDFGSPIDDYVVPQFAKPILKNGRLIGKVLHIDDFGNIISNISIDDLKQRRITHGISLIIAVGKKTLDVPFCSAYGEVNIGDPLSLIGSSGFLELSVHKGNASKLFKVKIGETFAVYSK